MIWTPLNYFDENGFLIPMLVPFAEEDLGVAFVKPTPDLERRCAIIATITIAATRQRHDPTFARPEEE